MLRDAAVQQMEVGMSQEAKGTAAAHERSSSFVSLLSGWVQQGLESFFATQRILVDLAMRQNTSAMKSFREGLSEPDSKDSPVKILTEIAVEGTSNYIEAQRILLDLAQQENDIIMNGVKERVSDYGPALAMTNVIRRSVETFVEMQQNFLVLASKRTQSWLEKTPESKRKDDGGLVGLAGEAMEEFVNAQKKFLDVITEETSGEAEDKKEHTGRKPSRTELAKLGQEATDSFIEAQKKLLDLASQQVNVNMQAASRAVDLKTPIRLLPMADIAGESVKSFVDAEKALLSSMTKSKAHAKEAKEEKATGRRTRHTGRRTRTAAGRAKAARAEVEVV
jgi:hypothetical protein